MADEIVRSMPSNIEAEQFILGAVIFDNDCLADVAQSLKVEDFYLEQHRKIFSAMVELSNRSQPVDLITLKSALEAVFDAVGGIDYLTQISLMVTTTANLKHHIDIVKNKALMRRLIRAANDIMDLGYSTDTDIPVILSNAESKIFDVLQNRITGDLHPIKEVLATNLARLEELMKNKEKVTGVPTGFRDLDMHTSGLQPSDLVLIAARPAMGKTSFALNIATNAAMRYQVPVAFFSLEMSKEQLANRILCSEGLISSEKMRVGDLDADDLPKLALTIDALSKSPIYIDDTPGITVTEIRSKCRRLKLKNQLGLIVIDYLQLMQGNGRVSRQEEVAANSRMLKILAKELDVPVITLSQLSRAPEQRTDHHPMLSDLRESGSIEQDADIVMLLYRDEVYNAETEKKNIAECIIAKFRNGSTRSIDLGWRGEFTRFMDLDSKHA